VLDMIPTMLAERAGVTATQIEDEESPDWRGAIEVSFGFSVWTAGLPDG
jgi:hypothetical protein